MAQCIFCKILNREIPTSFIYQDEEIVAFQDIKPRAPVHALIIPKRHISSLEELKEEDSRLLGKMILVAKNIASSKGIINKGCRLVINQGPDGGQEVDHLHLHLLGGRAMRWPPG